MLNVALVPGKSHKLLLSGKCMFCQTKQCIEVDRLRFDMWQEGMLIQNAFPNLDAETREFLISQICPECWQNL